MVASDFVGADGLGAGVSGFAAGELVPSDAFGAGSDGFGSGFGSSATAVAVSVTGGVDEGGPRVGGPKVGGPKVGGPALATLVEIGTIGGGAPNGPPSGGSDGFFTEASELAPSGVGPERGETLVPDDGDAGPDALGSGGGARRAPDPKAGAAPGLPAGRGAVNSARRGGGDVA